MNCPKCKNKSYVLETRNKDLFITRRYECISCKQRFTTHEMLYMIGARTKGSSSQHMKNMRKNAKRHDGDRGQHE